ncbi:MAG: 4Fe-4S dicluster domain-containing protein [Bacteroidetes bacterium]|nr:4Fe-4S dicluster domain-containing protein [Bacteroidota bacterium]
MQYLSQILFILILGAGVYFFYRSINRIIRNIKLGKDIDLSDNKAKRWKNMLRFAVGQGKMTKIKPIAGILHVFVYLGFVLINIEVLEIIIDGIAGTHRVFRPVLGGLYDFSIAFFEILGLLVIISCIIFLFRRNAMKIYRFQSPELKGWPFFDANVILVVEIVLMVALIVMNAADRSFQADASMPVSSFLYPMFENMSDSSAHLWVQAAWWFHFVGILWFLNYVPYSKHLHIILAFPNTYYTNLDPKAKFKNNELVSNEVKAMMDTSFTPPTVENPRFGVKDVEDLTWKNLLDAYSCTECGRCTSVCPANTTGKLLSPRKVMMDTRDRLEEVGKIRDGVLPEPEQPKDLHTYITKEELLACTTCNACVEVCPININPMDIIVNMRQYLVMEESAAPQEWNMMFSNIENNGAPWQFAQSERANWAIDLENESKKDEN